MLTDLVHSMVLLLVAVVWGSMFFFGVVVTPMAFRALAPGVAGPFIRHLVHQYYLWLGAASLLAALLLVLASPGGELNAALLALIGAGFLLARQLILPRINALREAAFAGDASAERSFQRWHAASVGLNAIQLVIVLRVLVNCGS